MGALLNISNLNKRFGGLIAVSDFEATVNKQEIFGLIGPNGSGKTTIINLITGFIKPDTGSCVFNGIDISGLRPDQIATAGISRTFQITSLFNELTVMDNLMIGCHNNAKANVFGAIFKTPSTKREETEIKHSIEDLMNYTNLGSRRNELAKNLTPAEHRRLMIAIALASKPTLLFLDEPAAGMTGTEINEMVDLIFNLRDTGITFFVIEHNMKFMTKLCDKISAINYGKLIATGTPSEVVQNTSVIEAYLGREKVAIN